MMRPRFTFTATIVRDLMAIEAARRTVQLTTLPPALAERLRTQAWLRSTHFSTRIEGNRLTLAEAQAAVLDGQRFPGRTTYTRCRTTTGRLQQVEAWAERRTSINEELIRKLHALIFTGPRARPTPYRDGGRTPSATPPAAPSSTCRPKPPTSRRSWPSWSAGLR